MVGSDISEKVGNIKAKVSPLRKSVLIRFDKNHNFEVEHQVRQVIFEDIVQAFRDKDH